MKKYLMLIRYKNGKDRVIERSNSDNPFKFPVWELKRGYDAKGNYVDMHQLSNVNPMQAVSDSKGLVQWVSMEDILDITIEENE